MLKVQNLRTSIDQKEILKGVNLLIGTGQIHVLMGQNGSGKSTLAQTLMGHPMYVASAGSVEFEGVNVLEMESPDRAKSGLFLSFQYPSEIPGVSISGFLRLIYNKKNGTTVSPMAFKKILKEKMDFLEMKEEFVGRYLNEGFSGGEKKRMEMLQMLTLEPKLAILDETDSGLDIDALKIVAKAVNFLNEKNKMAALVITHYARILKHLKPDFVHIMKEGVIVQSGSVELAYKLEEKGYSNF